MSDMLISWACTAARRGDERGKRCGGDWSSRAPAKCPTCGADVAILAVTTVVEVGR